MPWAVAVYVYGFASPVRTVLVHWEQLTATEQLRLKGMVASGAELAINNLKTPLSLKLVTRTLTPTLPLTRYCTSLDGTHDTLLCARWRLRL